MLASEAMRLGCLGCLGFLIVALVLGSLVAGGLWTWVAITRAPHLIPVSPMRADPGAVGRRLAEVGLREGNRSARGGPLAFSEAEAAAYLAQHLAEAGIRLAPISVSFRNGRMITQGQLPLKVLLRGPPFERVSGVIPRRILDAPVWITLTTTLRLDPAPGAGRARYGETMLVETEIGRLSVPGWLLTLMLGPRGASLLRWQVPAVVERVDIDDGRLTIRTR